MFHHWTVAHRQSGIVGDQEEYTAERRTKEKGNDIEKGKGKATAPDDPGPPLRATEEPMGCAYSSAPKNNEASVTYRIGFVMMLITYTH